MATGMLTLRNTTKHELMLYVGRELYERHLLHWAKQLSVAQAKQPKSWYVRCLERMLVSGQLRLILNKRELKAWSAVAEIAYYTKGKTDKRYELVKVVKKPQLQSNSHIYNDKCELLKHYQLVMFKLFDGRIVERKEKGCSRFLTLD